MRATAPVVLFLAAGCVEHVDLGARVPLDPSTASVILAFLSGEEVALHARAVGGMTFPAVPIGEDGDVDVVALLYDAPLEVLELGVGPLPHAALGAPSRGIPDFDRGWRAEIEGTNVGAFAEILELPAALAKVRIPLPDRTPCLRAGGCYPGQGLCVIPCPEHEAPAPPAPPEPPEPPRGLETMPDPEPPAPAALGPCAPGWVAVPARDADGVAICEPFPALPGPCAAGEAQLPGDGACTAIAGVCPAGDFADGLPASGVWYVHAAAVSGDGSAAQPFPAIADAVLVAAPGDTIALAKGVYDEAVTLPAGVTLRGACRETVIAPVAPPEAAIVARGVTATVRTLRVISPELGVLAGDGATLTLQGVEVDAPGPGWLAEASAIDARDVWVRGARCGACGGAGSVMSLERTIFDACVSEAIWSAGAVTLSDSIVRDTIAGEPNTNFGVGLATSGSSAVVTRSVFERNGSASFLIDETTTATVSDTIVRDTITRGDDRAVLVQPGGSLVLERTSFLDNPGPTIYARGPGTFRATDVVVDGIVPTGTTALGSPAIVATEGLRFRGERLHLRGADGHGIFTSTAIVDLRDVEVLDVSSIGPHNLGIGLAFVAATQAEATRVRAARCVGISAFVSRSTLALRDATWTELAASPSDTSVHLELRNGSAVRLERAHFVGPAVRAVFVDASVLVARDVRVSSGAASEVVGAFQSFGAGVALVSRAVIDRAALAFVASDGGRLVVEDAVAGDPSAPAEGGAPAVIALDALVRLTRVSIERASTTAVSAESALALALTDVTISDTLVLPGGDGGFGISVQNTSSVTLSRVAITGASTAGIYVRSTNRERLSFSDLTVEEIAPNPRGAIRGAGIEVSAASVLLERVAVARTSGPGVYADTQSEVQLHDVQVTGAGRSGLDVRDDAVVTLARVSLEESSPSGVSAEGIATMVSGTDVIVRAARLPEGAPTGGGVSSRDGALVSLTRFRLDHNTYGVVLESGRAMLKSGEVTANDVGVLVRGNSSDVKALLDGVRFSDNTTDLIIE